MSPYSRKCSSDTTNSSMKSRIPTRIRCNNFKFLSTSEEFAHLSIRLLWSQQELFIMFFQLAVLTAISQLNPSSIDQFAEAASCKSTCESPYKNKVRQTVYQRLRLWSWTYGVVAAAGCLPVCEESAATASWTAWFPWSSCCCREREEVVDDVELLVDGEPPWLDHVAAAGSDPRVEAATKDELRAAGEPESLGRATLPAAIGNGWSRLLRHWSSGCWWGAAGWSVLSRSALWTISILQTLCSCSRGVREGEPAAPAVRLRSSFKFDLSWAAWSWSRSSAAAASTVLQLISFMRLIFVLWSASCRFQTCVPVENDNICVLVLPEAEPDVEEEEPVRCCCCKLSSRRISDFLLPRNSCVDGSIAIRGATFSGCFRGSFSEVIPIVLLTKESLPVCCIQRHWSQSVSDERTQHASRLEKNAR